MARRSHAAGSASFASARRLRDVDPPAGTQLSDGGWPVERMGGGRGDARLPARKAAEMLREHLDLLRRIAEEGPAEVREFVEAVLALSDDPCPENIDKYLVASRALEGTRSSAKPESCIWRSATTVERSR